MPATIEIRDLHVEVENKLILKGLSLKINKGEIHALMGPNGSGKSTLSMTILGHPNYRVTSGDILVDGKSILTLPTDARAKLGLFLAFQYPVSIPGVSVSNFLRMAIVSRRAVNGSAKKSPEEILPVREFLKILREKMALLGLDSAFATRYVNDGFSGGEKKRLEILQMALLEPEFAILDETDSGLDIDALKTVSDGINKLSGPNVGILLITHYQRILDYVKPQFVHVLIDGKIAMSGGQELSERLEKNGYDWVRQQAK